MGESAIVFMKGWHEVFSFNSALSGIQVNWSVSFFFFFFFFFVFLPFLGTLLRHMEVPRLGI